MNRDDFILFLNTLSNTNQKISENFDTFFNLLINENSKYNLTNIINYEDVLEKHYFDSLSLLKTNHLEGKIVDVGCGAGFPSIPLKIVRPDLDITCLDSTAKKINFIQIASDKLNLNLKTINGRAEEIDEKFDIVVSRAVSHLNILLELCCNLVKLNGHVICMKGSKYKDELVQSQKCMEKLGYILDSIYEYELPSEDAKRANLVFKKVRNHDKKFPRNFAQMKKRPL